VHPRQTHVPRPKKQVVTNQLRPSPSNGALAWQPSCLRGQALEQEEIQRPRGDNLNHVGQRTLTTIRSWVGSKGGVPTHHGRHKDPTDWCLLFVLIRHGEGGANWCLFCINSTRGKGGNEPPRWIKALGKGDFLIPGGLYSVTALRENVKSLLLSWTKKGVTVYTKHRLTLQALVTEA
jgi:hypothetical protein